METLKDLLNQHLLFGKSGDNLVLIFKPDDGRIPDSFTISGTDFMIKWLYRDLGEDQQPANMPYGWSFQNTLANDARSREVTARITHPRLGIWVLSMISGKMWWHFVFDTQNTNVFREFLKNQF